MIRPGAVADIRGINPRDAAALDEWKLALEAVELLGDEWCEDNTVTILTSGMNVLGVIGWHQQAPGRFEAFALVDKSASDHAAFFVRDSRQAVEEACATWNVRRLFITVNPDDPQAEAYAASLGFKHEGFMRSYDEHGNDAYLMARILTDGTSRSA